MPQVSRGQAHYNTLLSLAELSFTMNGDGFYRNGQVANDLGKYLLIMYSNSVVQHTLHSHFKLQHCAH